MNDPRFLRRPPPHPRTGRHGLIRIWNWLGVIIRTQPVLAGTLLVGLAYAILGQGWQHIGGAMLVYCLGGYLIAVLCHRSRHAVGLFLLWSLAFVVDLGFKAFVQTIYMTTPDAPQVIESLSNTTGSESTEFLLNYWMLLGRFVLPLLALLGLIVLVSRTSRWTFPGGTRGVLLVCLAFGLLHVHPTVRKANPFVFWTVQASMIDEFRTNATTLDTRRELAERSLERWRPEYSGPNRHIVGLVIGESTNRWNWQLYGYGRPTTPELNRVAAEMLVFQDVISAAPSTVSSLRYMLTPRTLANPEGDESLPSVLLLAKAAGYKVFWISNQHDLYITHRFANEADVVRMVNPSVDDAQADDSRSLDERVLPAWREALEDPAPRKLIVAHLMGAHAHYDLRSPENYHVFENRNDEVDRELAELGRPQWVREKRAQYDDAMLYQDKVISQLLEEFRSAVGNQSGAWLYTSDHGEEVGHTRDFTGHAPDEPGQVVPLLVWHPECCSVSQKKRLESRPFQTDALDWTLLDLLQLKTLVQSPGDLLLRDSFAARERRLHDGSGYQLTKRGFSTPHAVRRPQRSS